MALDINHFRQVNRERSQQWHRNTEGWGIDQWNTAFIGEYGEAMNNWKKMTRVRDSIRGRDSETNLHVLGLALMTELADAFTYFDLLVEEAEAQTGLKFDQVLVNKFNKVSEQFNFPQRLQHMRGIEVTTMDQAEPQYIDAEAPWPDSLNLNNPCGPTEDEMFCACGCGGDDSRCAYFIAVYGLTDDQVRPEHTCCQIPGR